MPHPDQNRTKEKFLKWLFIRVPLVTLILFIILAGSLKLVERYPDPLKEGLEQFLSQRTNTNASIEILDHVQFFPNIIISLKNIKLHNRQNAAIIDLEIDEFFARSPLWSIFFNTRYIRDLKIKNLHSIAGFMTPKASHFDEISINTLNGPEQYGSFIEGNGTYDAQDTTFQIRIEKKGQNYKIPSAFPFSLQIGKTDLNATMVRKGSDMLMTLTTINTSNQEYGPQDYDIVTKGKYHKDQPFSCLLEYGNMSPCQIYLNP
ncbi:MAG: hypothetical protein MRY79_02275 [Alphaproteobacteria bacterium]|nr:hypothetical protein [Alphaproteobacteria bacterium]